MVRFAFAQVGTVQPAPRHTISEYVQMASMTNQAAKFLILQPALTAIRDPAEWIGSFAE